VQKELKTVRSYLVNFILESESRDINDPSPIRPSPVKSKAGNGSTYSVMSEL